MSPQPLNFQNLLSLFETSFESNKNQLPQLLPHDRSLCLRTTIYIEGHVLPRTHIFIWRTLDSHILFSELNLTLNLQIPPPTLVFSKHLSSVTTNRQKFYHMTRAGPSNVM